MLYHILCVLSCDCAALRHRASIHPKQEFVQAHQPIPAFLEVTEPLCSQDIKEIYKASPHRVSQGLAFKPELANLAVWRSVHNN